MDWYYIVLICFGAFLIILIILGFILHSITYCRSLVDSKTLNKYLENSPISSGAEVIRQGAKWIKETPKEEVYITSNDGLNLKGYFIKSEVESKKVFILVHGYHSAPYCDFSASAQDLRNFGFNLLLIEQRAHENSEGKYTTFGVKERYDVYKWIEYINNRFENNVQIVLVGVSMGAATVMYTLGLDLPKTVKGAICDCGYTSPLKVAQYTIRHNFHLPPYILSWFMSFASFVRTGKFLSKINTKDTLSRTKIPVLLIHGDKDEMVPLKMGLENYNYLPEDKRDLLIVPGAGHAASYVIDKEEYQLRVKNLLDKCIK